MSSRRFLPLLFLFALVGLSARGRAPAAAAPAADPPFSHLWVPYATIWRSSETHSYQYYSFADPVHHRLYVAAEPDANTTVYNTDTGAVVGHVPLSPSLRDFNAGNEHLVFQSVPTLARDPRVNITYHVIDAATLAPIRAVTYACPDMGCLINDVAEGPDGRLYVARYAPGAIDVVDGDSGAILYTLPFAEDGNTAVSLDTYDATLYVAGYFPDEGQSGLARYDISQPTPVRLSFDPIDVGALDISPDGRYLTISNGPSRLIQQYRLEPFALLWTSPFDFVANFADGGVLAINTLRLIERHELTVSLDAETGQTTYSMLWLSALMGQQQEIVRPLPDGGIAVFYQNRIELRRPVDYAVVLPTVFNRACFVGSIIDDFHHSGSGWPAGQSGSVTYGYTPDGYTITLGEAGQWIGLSRGDYWDNADLLSVGMIQVGDPDTRVGAVGIIYGLNDDWSDFYTVEAIDYNHWWRNFHFHDGQWELLQAGRYVNWAPTFPIQMEFDRQRSTDEVLFKLAASDYLPIDIVPGRVGIMAASGTANVSANFLNYRFDGDNCVENNYGPSLAGAAPTGVAPTDVAPASIGHLRAAQWPQGE